MNNAILIFGLIFIVMVLITGAIAIDVDACVEIQGIDHNSKNEPFTVFLGDC